MPARYGDATPPPSPDRGYSDPRDAFRSATFRPSDPAIWGKTDPAPPLTDEQERAALEAYCQYYLHISAAEFLARWRAGEWPDPDSVPGLMRVVMILPEHERRIRP